jgi:hypothetical protein
MRALLVIHRGFDLRRCVKAQVAVTTRPGAAIAVTAAMNVITACPAHAAR